jgi:release factor glutamine methyltransferase
MSAHKKISNIENTGCPALAGPGHLNGATIAGARRILADMFRKHSIDSPEIDARVLIGYGLGLDHAALASNADRLLTADEARTIFALAARRLAREPAARIIGSKEFWSLPFDLTSATLVPRPETETVVETALAKLDAGGSRMRALRIADLGTGSGALLLALLSELPNTVGIGTDINPAAVEAARKNAARLGLAARTQFAACNFAAALRGPFDLVVANPPYIASGDVNALSPEVREHDPLVALDGGADGLAAYRALAADARRILAPDGILVVELGAGQAVSVAAILLDGGIAADPPARDLSGQPRALPGRPIHAWKASPG